VNELELFAAIAGADPAERASLLDRECAGDPAKRDRLEALLRAHDRPDSLLDRPAVAPHEPDTATTRTIRLEGGAAAEVEVSLGFLAPPTRPDSLGRLGHYEVLQVLGRGSFGIVFKAFDESLHRVVAVKVLSPEMAATSPARKRFLREARASAPIRHENVVQVYAIEEAPLPYIVMEFIPGRTLQDLLDCTGPLDIAEVIRIGTQIARGLAAAHERGLVHRDIKPANILLEGGVDWRVKITDFGLARSVDDASMTASGVVAGTPLYMSPEQARGETLDHHADLFSLGSVLYTMCAGHPPFRANSTLAVLKRVCDDVPRPIPEIIPETPHWLCDLIAKLHAKNPDERFQSAKEVADLLAKGAAEPPPPKAELVPAHPTGPRRSNRGLTVAAGVLVLAVVAIFAATQGNKQPDRAGTKATEVGVKKLAAVLPQRTIEWDGGVIEPKAATPIEAEQRKALEWVLSVGGTVDLLVGSPLRPVRLEGRVPDGRAFGYRILLSNIKAVDDAALEDLRPMSLVGSDNGIALDGTSITDAGLARLAEFRGLAAVQYLSLNNTSITDAGVAHLKRFPAFRNGGLSGTQVTDAGLKHLCDGPVLNQLNLAGLAVTDAGLAHLARCKTLTIAWLNGTKVTEGGVKKLAAALPQCKIVWDGGTIEPKVVADPDRKVAEYVLAIGGEVGLNDQRLESILKPGDPLPPEPFRLVYVDLSANPKVTDAGLAVFKGCKNVLTINLYRTPVTNTGLAHLEDCKNLTALNLTRTAVTDAGLAVFKGCEKLELLQLDCRQVGDQGVANFANCKSLTRLGLNGTQVTDAGLALFRDCTKLQEVSVQGTKITGAGLVALKGCPELRLIGLNETPVGDDDLTHFNQWKFLRELHLHSTPVTDVGLDHLMGCKNLKVLQLQKTKVTAEGVKKFAAALPQCKIEWDGGVIEPKK